LNFKFKISVRTQIGHIANNFLSARLLTHPHSCPKTTTKYQGGQCYLRIETQMFPQLMMGRWLVNSQHIRGGFRGSSVTHGMITVTWLRQLD
jgi:hypothetical protein